MEKITSNQIAKGELEKDQIQAWVTENIPEERIYLITTVTDKTEKEVIYHVTTCIHHLVLWYNEPKAYIGKFLRYMLLNRFTDTIRMADSTNKRLLDVYATFLYQYMPSDYKQKAKDLFGEDRP